MTLQVDVGVLRPEAPFRGIEPFRFIDQSIYFGRDEDAWRLFELVSVYRGVLLYGDSGVGKTSLINARFVPACLDHGFLPEIIRVRPRVDQELLVERIALSSAADGGHLPSLFVPPDSPDERVPVSVMEAAEAIERMSGRRAVLIFDQFEEFVTLFEESGDQEGFRQAQAAQQRIRRFLIELIRDSRAPAKVLFTFREDYLGKLMELFTQAPNLPGQYLRLSPLTIDELPHIVRGPFDANRGVFTTELSETLAARLQAVIGAQSPSGLLNLSEVQIVCKRLFESHNPEQQLTSRGLVGLLGDYLADRLKDFSATGREAAVILLDRLVTAAGTRNVVSEEDLLRAEPPISRADLSVALARLETDRLVRRESRRDVFFYEIVSEVLIPSIRGERQAQKIRWQEAQARAAEAKNREAAARERALREAQLARRQRQLRLIAVGLALGAVLVVALLVYAYTATSRAANSEMEAQAGRLRAFIAESETQIARETAAQGVERAARAEAEANQSRARADAAWFEAAVDRSVAAEALAAATQARLQAERDSRSAAEALARAVAAEALARQQTQLADTATDIAATATADATTAREALASERERLIEQQAQLELTRAAAEQAQANAEAQRVLAQRAQTEANAARTEADAAVRAALQAERDAAVAVAAAAQARADADLAAVEAETARADARTAQQAAAQADQEAAAQREVAQAALDAATRYRQDADLRIAELQRIAQTNANAASTDRLVQYPGPTVPPGTGPVTAIPPGGLTSDVLSGTPGGVSDAHLRPGGDTVVVAGRDGVVRLWTPASDETLVLRGHTGAVYTARYSHGERWVVTGGEDRTTRVWDAFDGTPRSVLQGHSGAVRAVLFSPDGQLVASGSDDGTVRLWQPTVPEAYAVLMVGKAAVTTLAFNSEGTRVAVGGADGASVWETGGKRLFSLATEPVTSVAFGPVDRWIVTADVQGTARVFNAVDGTLYRTLNGHSAAVNTVAFAPTGPAIVTSSDDQTARIWDLDSGKSLVLSGHSGPVRSAVFSTDGALLLTASADRSAWMWNATTGDPLVELRGHTDAVFNAELTADGRWAMTASADGTVRVWPIQDVCSGPVLQGFGRLWRSDSELRNALGCSKASAEPGIAGIQAFPNGLLFWWDPESVIYVFYGQLNGRWERHELGRYTGQPVGYPCASGRLPQRGFGQFLAQHDDIAAALGRCPTTDEEGPGQANSQFGSRQFFDGGLLLFMPATDATGEKLIWAMVNQAGSSAAGTFTRHRDLDP